MNADDLSAIRLRIDAATRGPWTSEPGYNNAGMPTRFFRIPGHNGNAEVEMLADDASFITHARDDVPKLVERIAELEAKLRSVGDLLSENGCDCDCDHHHEEHDDDCERCLACRIGEAIR